MPVGETDTGIELTGAVPALPIPMAALVTGGAQRIGQALALSLAKDGFALAIHYNRSQNAAERLAARIRGDGGKALPRASHRSYWCNAVSSKWAKPDARLRQLLAQDWNVGANVCSIDRNTSGRKVAGGLALHAILRGCGLCDCERFIRPIFWIGCRPLFPYRRVEQV